METIISSYTTSELFTLANSIRKEQQITQKEAFAQARVQLENRIIDVPVKKGRGHYVRNAEWRKNHSAKMKTFWEDWRAAHNK